MDKNYFICEPLHVLINKDTCLKRRESQRFQTTPRICRDCKQHKQHQTRLYSIGEALDGVHREHLQSISPNISVRPITFVSDTKTYYYNDEI